MPVENGPKGNPRFDLDDDSDFPADLTALSDWVAKIADRSVTTTGNRDSISPKWAGMTVYVTANQILYLWTGAKFEAIGGVRVSADPGYQPGVNGTSSIDFLFRDYLDMVELYWQGTYVDPLGDGAFIGTVPAGFRPPSGTNVEIPASMNIGGTPGSCLVTINSGGAIQVYGIGGSGNRRVSFYTKYQS